MRALQVTLVVVPGALHSWGLCPSQRAQREQPGFE